MADLIDCLMIQELKERIREERERKEILTYQFRILMDLAPEGF
jgi:hypothetical protein